MATAYCTYDLRIAQFGCAGQSDGSGEVGDPDVGRELLPVSCAESYSKSVATKSTPGMLCRKLISIYSNESYSLYITQRATPCLLC